MRLRPALLCALAAFALAAAPADARLTLGLGDPVYDGLSTDEVATTYLDRTKDAGSSIVRVTAYWRSIAATKPADPTDPDAPEYDFTGTDRAVQRATAAGQKVLLLVTSAPDWAEPSGRPSRIPAGAWQPDPQAFGQFMRAVATRYSGARPGVPAVAAYQVWNEPNLPVYLAPQWSGKVPRSPELYRDLLNAAYAGIKAATPSTPVVMAGLAPYGDPQPGGNRVQPALFTRKLLCQNGTARKPTRARSCPDPARLDVWSHHPYGVGSPYEKPAYADDVTLGSLSTIVRSWKLAESRGGVSPRKRKPRWVTEFGWESSPDPTGLKQQTQALWMGQALERLDAAGFRTTVWYRILDDRPTPNYGFTTQSGLYTASGKAKPSLAMFRFPVAVVRSAKGRARAWALPPSSGTCRLERRSGTRWRTVLRGTCKAGTPWIRATRRTSSSMRVRVGDVTSPIVRISGPS